jgi:hypothetical protein
MLMLPLLLLLLQVLTDGTPDQQLLLPLAVVMAQHLDWSLFTLHTQHLKELAEQHDRVNEICQQVGVITCWVAGWHTGRVVGSISRS